jgi:drug/metabolite transporter (DMT)-like permease
MIAVVLGLGAALAYGLSDFIAGRLSRRMHYALVALVGNVVAFGSTILALVLSTPAVPTSDALLWGAASGLGGGFGTLMLYRGLGRGRMGVVAPLSALGAAVLPLVVGVVLGDRPSPPAWVGVLLALPAIWLVSTSARPGADGDGGTLRMSTAEVVDGLLAGVGFALLFVGLGLAGEGSGLWPVVAGQASSVAMLAAVLAGSLRGVDIQRTTSRDYAGAASVGVLGGAASILYFLSTHEGLLSIVAVLTSLYPAVTVLLAAVVLHEAISRRQGVGLALAGLAVVLIVLG